MRDEAIDYTTGIQLKLKVSCLFVSSKSSRLSSRPVEQATFFKI